jgi:ATP-dependent helicase/nuclease subunit A
MTPVGTLITANAGCGKTYGLANRVIGWMVEHKRLTGDAGAADILAATFTRKAAGEIQDRVLAHLAEGAVETDALASFAESIAIEPPPTCDEVQAVLEDVVRCLDRMQVSTLDGVFSRLAKAFPEEVGLPEGWTIADHPVLREIQRQALDDWLSAASAEEISTLAREAEAEILKGSAHKEIIKHIWGGPSGGGLLSLWRRSQIRDDDTDPWDWVGTLSDDAICADAASQKSETLRSVVETLKRIDLPQTKKGTTVLNWKKSNDKLITAISDGLWMDLLTNSIVMAALSGEQYCSHDVSDAYCEAIRPAVSHARADLVRRIRAKMSVWRQLLGGLDAAYRSRQRAAGCYNFCDITDRLARANLLKTVGADQLAWRLDSKIRDIALDEFQDTSMEQARVMQPVLEEMVSGEGAYDTPRHLLVVADPKQSIYAWRGGTPAVLNWVKQLGGDAMAEDELTKSYRSAKIIMDFVNAAFESMDTNAALLGASDSHEAVPDAVMARGGLAPGHPGGPIAEVLRDWKFEHHESALKMDGGIFAWLTEDDGDAVVRHVVALAKRRWKAGVGIGILCLTNDQVAEVAHQLRVAGVPVSEEGNGGAADLPAVAVLLDLLRLGDHPGHRKAAFTVSHSPFAALLDLSPLEDTSPEIRAEVLEAASARIRDAVADEGLGPFIARLTRAVEPQCDAREQAGLRLVAELAAGWTSTTTTRLRDFVLLVAEAGFAAPTTATVRVMTQHKAKGLEFDEVILPWLDKVMAQDRVAPCFPWSPEPLADIAAIAPHVRKELRVHAPILKAFHNQSWASDLADALSLLYVAITRPRTGLHLIFRKLKNPKQVNESLTPATFLRAAIPELDQAMENADPHDRDHFWAFDGSVNTSPDEQARDARPPTKPVRVTPIGARSALVTPSSHAVVGSLAERFRLVPGRARRDGVILHELYRHVQWLDDGPPPEALIEQAFDEAAIQLGRPAGSDLRAALLDRFTASLEGEVGNALRRAAHASWNAATLEALPEHPVLVRLDSGMLRGRIDRLVLGRDASGAITHAAILDYKTGHAGTEAERQAATEWYQPQLDRYAEGVAAAYSLSPDAIETELLFVE